MSTATIIHFVCYAVLTLVALGSSFYTYCIHRNLLLKYKELYLVQRGGKVIPLPKGGGNIPVELVADIVALGLKPCDIGGWPAVVITDENGLDIPYYPEIELDHTEFIFLQSSNRITIKLEDKPGSIYFYNITQTSTGAATWMAT